MLTPHLVLGRGGGIPSMLTANDGWEDDGVPYEMVVGPRGIAPAGIGGEAIFTALYLATVNFEDVITLFVTPIVDGVELETQSVTLPLYVAGNPNGRVRVTEFALSVPYIRDGIERMRVAPRGTWFDARIETKIGSGNAASTMQFVDGIEVEFEVVRESRASQ